MILITETLSVRVIKTFSPNVSIQTINQRVNSSLFLQKAEAELAYELQAAKTKQRIKEEQMQIKVIERTQEILVQVYK